MHPVLSTVRYLRDRDCEPVVVRMGLRVIDTLTSKEKYDLSMITAVSVEPDCHPDFYCVQNRGHQVLETGLM